MLGSIATCAIITIEIGIIGHQLYRSGYLDNTINKVRDKLRLNPDIQVQPKPKELCSKIITKG